jgi:signal transduction histidine kinase
LLLRLALERRSASANYLIGLVLAVAGCLISVAFDRSGLGATYLPPLVFTVFVAVICGLGPAVLVSLGSALVLDWFVIGPWVLFEDPESLTRFAIYISVAPLVAIAVSELRSGYLQAEALGLAKENVLSVVSHDLRNPLSSIQMYAALLLRQMDQGGRLMDPADGLRGILRSTERMNRIIGDLLDATKIEKGSFSMQEAPENVSSILEETLDAFRSVARERRIELQTEIPSPPPSLLCDRTRLIQALSNLVQNAIKYSPSNGVVRIQVQDANSWLRIFVSDQGPGIPEKDIDHIFERYWTARKPEAQGTGLGLFISRGIAKSHGGTLTASNRPEGGSVFCLAVPVKLDRTIRSLRAI